MKGKLKHRILIWILALAFTAFFFHQFLELFTLKKTLFGIRDFNKGWDITYHDETYDQADLTEFEFKRIKAGDVITLTNQFPVNMRKGQTMMLTTYLSTVDIWVDGQRIYTYGHDLADEGKMLGSGYHLVTLPENVAYKTIEITVVAHENDAFSSMDAISYGTVTELFYNYMKTNLMTVLICIFLVVLGATMTGLLVVSVIMGNSYIKFLPITVFSFLAGMYGLCSVKFFEICGLELEANTIGEYVSLYLAPVPVILLFATLGNNPQKVKKIICAIGGLLGGFGLVAICLHAGNVMHFPRVLKAFHFVTAIVMLISIIIGIKQAKKSTKVNWYIAGAFSALCICTLMDMVRINVQKYINPNSRTIGYSFLPIGALLFIVLLMINSMISVYHMEMEATEKRILANLAYTDVLCKIYNRTKSQQRFEELRNKKENYALVNFDLNGLKVVNDKQGHARGDIMLQEFAKVLAQSFHNVGEVYRMGGDEFMAIVCGKHISKIDEAILKMKELLVKHSERIDMKLDTSYGIAYSSEIPEATTEKVYSLADERMYEMKLKHYEEIKQTPRQHT